MDVFPKAIGFVSDFEDTFTAQQKLELEKLLVDYEKQSTREIAIVTVNSIEPYTDKAIYSMDLANHWAIGKTDKDNGLLIVISKSLRKIRISFGYHTEKTLANKIYKTIIDDNMVPELKKDNYYKRVNYDLLQLM